MKKTHCFLWFCFLLVILVLIGFGVSDGSWFFRWILVFPMASIGCLFLYLFNFLTAASAKAAEFSLCRSSKLRVSGRPASRFSCWY